MKSFVAASVVIVAGLSAPALAQQPAPAPVPPGDAPKAPAQAAPPANPEAAKKAEGVLKDSAKAYASAKALNDKISFTAKTPQGDQSQSMTIAYEGADKARINMDEMTFTAVGGALYAEKTGITDKFAQFAVEGDLAATLGSEIGFVPPQFVARGSDDMEKLLAAWTFGMLPNPKVSNYAMGKSEAGNDEHVITLTGDGGGGMIHVNGKTMLVEKVMMHVKPDGAPEDFNMDVTLAFEPKVADAASPAIAFDAGTRTKVSSVDDLKVDLTGKPAPDFTLETLDGSKVTLSELKGNVVILDFWATWCGPCKMALPKLNEFAQWAKDNNPKVKIYGVDVWERSKPDETKKAVSEFWTSKGYVMPTLLDLDNAVAKKFGFDAIPTTIIVGPDGKIAAVHTGYDEDMVNELKKNVEEALAAKGN